MALNAGNIVGFIGADNSAWLDATKEAATASMRFARDAEKQFKRAGASMKRVGTALSVAVTAPLVLMAKSADSASMDLARMQTRLEFATGSAKKSADAFSFVSGEVSRLGIELLPSIEGFSNFSAAAKGTSLEGQGARDIFIGMSQAIATLGLTTDQSKGAFVALEQIMSKGKVQAEELRGQLGERIPGAFQIASRAMGKTTMELSKMLEMGEVLSEEFLPKFAAELKKTFQGETPANIRVMNEFSTSFLFFKKAIADAGITKAFMAMRIAATRLFDAFTALSPQTQESIVKMAALAVAIGPTILGVGLMTTTIGIGIGLLATFAGGLATVASFAVALVVPLSAVALGAALLWDAFGSLLPSFESVGGGLAWLQGIMGETATFWGAVTSNILGNTKTLTDEQQKGVGIIAKVWLGLKVTWKIIVVAMQDTVIGLTAVVDGFVLTMASLASLVGLDSLAAGYRKTSLTIQEFVFNLNKSRIANEKAAQGIIDSWDKAPETIRADAARFKTAVSEIGAQALEGLKGMAPEAVAAVQALIDNINASLATGAAGRIELPVGPAAEPFGPEPLVVPGVEFGPGTDQGIFEGLAARNAALIKAQNNVNEQLSQTTTEFHEKDLSAWETWKNSQVDTLNNWKDNALMVAVGVKKAFADNLAATIVSGKSFSKAMISTFQSMGQQLISMAIGNAITQIAISFAVTKAKGVASAPSPVLIPLFVGLAVAGFAAAMSGTMFGSSGGGGGAVSAPAAASIAPEAATVSRIEDSEDIQGGGDGIRRLIVEGEFGDKFMEFAVRESKNGRGDGVDRLLTTADS